jgi:hypothetical protein
MSATACIHFYNAAVSRSNEPPPGWPFGFTLSMDHVWSAFLLYCLLEDAIEHNKYVVIKHMGDHKDHLSDLV